MTPRQAIGVSGAAGVVLALLAGPARCVARGSLGRTAGLT
jgi:hypothetical protein